MRSLIHSTMWWNGLRRFRGASVQQAWHANLTKVSKIQGGRQTRRPRRQHSSLQWLIRSVTYTMVSLCSLLQACRLLAATRGSIPYWLLPTMGYHSWEWTCYHSMASRCLPLRSCASTRQHWTITPNCATQSCGPCPRSRGHVTEEGWHAGRAFVDFCVPDV